MEWLLCQWWVDQSLSSGGISLLLKDGVGFFCTLARSSNFIGTHGLLDPILGLRGCFPMKYGWGTAVFDDFPALGGISRYFVAILRESGAKLRDLLRSS